MLQDSIARTRWLFLAAIPICVQPAFARQDPFAGGGSSTIPWPAETIEGAPGRAVAGDFTGDLRQDVVFLCEGEATLVYGPGYFSAFVPLAGEVRDAARVDASAPGAADGLLVLDGSGLRLLTDYDAGGFTSTPVASGSPWDCAGRVVVGDVESDGYPDAVGVGEDEQTILVTRNILGFASPPTSFTLPHEILDVVVTDWSPAPAIVAMTTGGLYVRTWDGSPVATHAGTSGYVQAALVKFREAGLAHERTALVYTIAGSDYLAVVDKDGIDDFVPLGPIGAYALTAGDVDRDGLDDLVVLHRYNHMAILLRNQGAQGGFSLFEGVDIGAGAQPASTQTAFPILADLTNDSDLDLFVHVAASGELRLIENGIADRRFLAPEVLGGHYLYTYADGGSGTLSLDCKTGAAPPFEPTDIELVVWTQSDLESPLDPQALHHLYFPLDAYDKANPVFTVAEPDMATSKLYHLDMRPVSRDAGLTVEAGPTAVWSFATPTPDVAALESAYGNEPVPIRIFWIDEQRYLTADEEDVRILTPSTVQGDKVPPSEEPPDPFDD